METIKRINDTGISALPIMLVGGGIVWVLLCEVLFQLGVIS